MTLLPIVGRELRIAARRAGTYWLRCLAAGVAVGLGASIYLAGQYASPPEMSRQLFFSLGIVAFAFSMLAGVFMTADCLAEEKREGTLGLLFLTDLKAYDVVFGKLAATSLHAVFGLVAIVPVLALPLMMGGVTGREFARLLLVLGASLFFSLNLGLLISAYSREARQAFTRGIFWIVMLGALFPLLRWLFYVWSNTATYDFLFWPSPVCAFVYSFDAQYVIGNGSENFWMSAALTLFLSCVFLVWTNVVLPQSWRHAGDAAGGKKERRGQKTTKAIARVWIRGRVYCRNPIYWLAMGDAPGRSQARRALFWLTPLWFLFAVAAVFSTQHISAFCASFFLAYGLHVLVKVLYVTEACQRLFQERQSGALELVLVTPISVEEILAGQRLALRKHFKGAFIILCAINLGTAWLVAAIPDLLDMHWQDQGVFLEVIGGGILMLWLDLRALAWVGMWRGLNARRGYRAVLGTLGQIMLIPWLGIFFVGVIKEKINSTEEAMVWVALWFLLCVLVNLVGGHRARNKLSRQFRQAARQRFQPNQ